MRCKGAVLVSLALLCSINLFAGDDRDDKDKDQNKEKPAQLTVHARDYCDPTTFAQIGCKRDASTGFITLAGFGQELATEKSVGAWRYVASQSEAEGGAQITVSNLGGETHTFTRVKEFGGGFVAGLNAASGNPNPAAECAKMSNGTLVPQPASSDNLFLPAGASASAEVKEGEVANFQCCIHPWMRVTINTRDKDDKGRDKEK